LKAVEESGKPLKKIEFPVRKNWILGEGKSQYFPRDSPVSGDFRDSFPTCDW
jgi:hypothetical protein